MCILALALKCNFLQHSWAAPTGWNPAQVQGPREVPCLSLIQITSRSNSYLVSLVYRNAFPPPRPGILDSILLWAERKKDSPREPSAHVCKVNYLFCSAKYLGSYHLDPGKHPLGSNLFHHMWQIPSIFKPSSLACLGESPGIEK